ncbi:hypothetical protein JCM10908_002606 [Rhodotorula pacifica]|uniref:uncharacterized protein n=1 Tax=Rhodotorula pacifica TaxID=1495444 RepID=UPI00317DC7B2
MATKATRRISKATVPMYDESMPWMAGIPRDPDDPRTGLDLLGEEILAFYEWAKPTDLERQLRAQVFECFKKVVEQIWPDAKCELFGSMQTGIYLPDGDFDVVIQDPKLRHHPTYSVLSALKTAVVKCRFAEYHAVRLITGAKVPILKLKTSDRFGRFDMDISFNSEKGPDGARESLRLLEEVERKRPGNAERVKRLALLLKTLLVTHKLNEVRDGGLGGLTVFCMALSHVQLDRTPIVADRGQEAALDLIRFLSRYGCEWDYFRQTITTANGGGLLYKAVRFPNSWPGRLSIVHPVEPSRDLASGSFAYEQVVTRLATACEELEWFSQEAARYLLAEGGLDFCALGLAGISASWQSRAQRYRNYELIDEQAIDDLVRHYWPYVVNTVPTAYLSAEYERWMRAPLEPEARVDVGPSVSSEPVPPPTFSRPLSSSSVFNGHTATIATTAAATAPLPPQTVSSSTSTVSPTPPTSPAKYSASLVTGRNVRTRKGEKAQPQSPPTSASKDPYMASSANDIDQLFARMSLSFPSSPPAHSDQSINTPTRLASAPTESTSTTNTASEQNVHYYHSPRALLSDISPSPPHVTGEFVLVSESSNSGHSDEVVYKAPIQSASTPAAEAGEGDPAPSSPPPAPSSSPPAPPSPSAPRSRIEDWTAPNQALRGSAATISLPDWSYAPPTSAEATTAPSSPPSASSPTHANPASRHSRRSQSPQVYYCM